MTATAIFEKLIDVRILEKKVPNWEKKISIALEIFIGVSGVYQTFLGDTTNGLLILVCFGLIVFPKFFTRNKIKQIPIEIEIFLFLMVLLQYVLGGVHDLYNKIPYYDKLVHFMLPLFVGTIGFLIAYTMYATNRLKASGLSIVIIVSLLSLGVGALWEIFEYSSDTFIYPFVKNWHHFQGNAQQSANADTMTDLIDDFLGGIFGSVLGLMFIRHTNKNGRLGEFVQELESDIFNEKKNYKK